MMAMADSLASSQLPIIRHMHDAADHHERAAVLLRVPDIVLMKHRGVFEDACRRAQFEAGIAFIEWRRATWHAVRDPDGQLADPEFDAVRSAFAAFARREARQ